MKKLLIIAILFTMAFVSFAFADKTKITAKVGDELYFCPCGDDCLCDTISRNPGKCTCGKDLIKAKVTKVETGKISIEARKRPFVSVGKYACACGPDCKCDTISQNPGNCTCGKKMTQVKAPAKK